ncbi:glycoside hydrolase family 95 protein [Paenibacillus alginolyticus]|uniref:glycosyl hydrolase family 95 catalytic domain-containing protein n=1 Tax=Paenibacillus alginolyticus TaxID=59839 RepID=UPI0003FEFCBE|nr:glycoside hydrolase N-terminal domain-containing protein [Paenibacillus alginolyticus]MCY9668119.1 glycoside hydrolase family 95 protein [Paenibacillus alginolyticus]
MDMKHGMIMRQPASRWQDALPCGNGTYGALVYGSIYNDTILLNHEALFWKSQKPELSDVSHHLPEFRRLLMEGKYRKGMRFFADRIAENYTGYERVDPYQPAFDLKIHMPVKEAFRKYRRSLDFETGEAVTTWHEDGKRYEKRLFVSRSDDVVVMAITSPDQAKINCELALFPHDVREIAGEGEVTDSSGSKLPFRCKVELQGHLISLTGTYEDGNEFGGMARVAVTGGELKQNGLRLLVSNADEVVILVKLFANEPGAAAIDRIREDIGGIDADYPELLRRHAAVHSELFNRVRLKLVDHAEIAGRVSNEELLMGSYDGDVSLELVQKMVEYGRYLLISSSRPGGLPANLQGIWNGDYNPAWAADFHNDENIQMNYWAALPGNLPETVLPFFDYYESMLDDFRTNAKLVYRCRGILVPICQTTHGLIYKDGQWVSWIGGAGWLAQLFYDYWLYTKDREFLQNRAVPFLREVAEFYEDFLIDGEDGQLMFIPSQSPENQPAIAEPSRSVINAAMDIAIAKEVLTNLSDACELFQMDSDRVQKWKTMASRLPAYSVNEEGAAKEWIHKDLPDNYHHRHQSHIYPVFPGYEVTEESNPAIFKAMAEAVEKRLVIGLSSQSGWSFAHMANIYARLGQGNRAQDCLELLCRSCVGPNLFTYHNDWRNQGVTMAMWGTGAEPPFQIDANFGITSAVIEMLVFSAPGMIKLLPALPDKWKKGSVSGLLCRGGIRLSIEWCMDEKRVDAIFTSVKEMRLELKLPFVPNHIHTDGIIVPSHNGDPYRTIHVLADRPLKIEVR